MPIDKDKLMALWQGETFPVCDDGMVYVHTFLQAAVDAVDQLDDIDGFAARNAIIRHHKALVGHRSTCEKCNEADPGIEAAE